MTNILLAAMQAGLIIVYASSGRTASLVAKYRPKMPILTLVVPHLKSSALKWELQGRSLARQCLIMRGQAPAPCPFQLPLLLCFSDVLQDLQLVHLTSTRMRITHGAELTKANQVTHVKN